MIKVVTTESMRRIEAAADTGGLSYAELMENAGRATAYRALEILAEQEDARVTVLVGAGNNGGDGLVAGRVIAEQSKALVRFYLLKKRTDDDPNLKKVRDLGLLVADAEDDQRYRVLHHMVGSAHLLIDALFGIGVRLPLTGDAAKVLQAVERALKELRELPSERPIIQPTQPGKRTANVPYILAVDCPSGLNCDTGEIDRHALQADETITYIAAKPGLLTFPGAAAVGALSVSTIGVPENLPELKAEKTFLIDAALVRERLPQRPPNSHKGTYGKALIVAGSANYVGAPGMAAQAAYRAGAGLVTVAAPQQVINSLAVRLFEPTWLPITPEDAAQKVGEVVGQYETVVLGPGWGQESTTQAFLSHLLDSETQFSSLVIDADGLNLLAQMDEWWQKLPAQTVLTPHPGEMARLSGLDTAGVQKDRLALAKAKAEAWGVVLVLKGAHTIIAAPDGQTALLPFKTDALAKAGTGDVLAGMIGGLLAQGLEPFDAALVGGYVHGMAGQIATQARGSTRSVMASDVLDAIGQGFRLLEA